MSTSVLPYANVINDEEEIDYIVIKFSGFNSNILVHEEYCVNPGCSCADAVLRFIELSDDGEPVNDWFLIRLDMHTWKVTEKKVLNKMIKAEKMIKEFVDNIDEFKEKLLSHFIKAKEYGKKHYIDYMSDSTVKMILDGNVMAYSEIFGSCDIDKFSFEFNETEKWFFDDQYCSNPKCLCYETVLTFFKIDDSKKTQEPEFAVRMNINNFKYDVEFNKCETNRVSEVVKFLHDSKPEVFGILKRRYNEVKSASKEIIKKFSSNEKKEEPPNIKVGRNDPCPCGSGKKYKKCCGR
jgi:hypothetical protein